MIETYIVDSFTDSLFKGNPAGVCLLDEPIDEALMLNIAKELNFSETAFVSRDQDSYNIRYFSPVMEIPLCGHATLAAAAVIYEEGYNGIIHFKTHGGITLPIKKVEGLIEMEFPIYDYQPSNAPTAVLDALGLTEVEEVYYNQETSILMLVIKSASVISELQPDFVALKQSHSGINGVLVTAASQSELYDYESRYFWPWSGTNEDPATGGIQTFLARYWSIQLKKSVLSSYQSSLRTGKMQVEITERNTIYIRSSARIVLKGMLHI